MRRLAPIAVALIAVFALGGAVAASAGQPKQPPAGAWKVSGGVGGFTLKKGKGGKVLLTNFHLRTPAYEACESKEATARVVGSYSLKTFTRGGYTAWGVGKNKGGDAVEQAGKVEFGGKVRDGGFYVIFDYENPRQAIGGSISFGDCRAEFAFATPK
ncbi:MAG TPA: hypothetical protein VFJ57_10840 [Solirubrobacterales bacterium]|nr:hypothetical protein [Solirubrobacterales bacterium]